MSDAQATLALRYPYNQVRVRCPVTQGNKTYDSCVKCAEAMGAIGGCGSQESVMEKFRAKFAEMKDGEDQT